eukprot:189477_1
MSHEINDIIVFGYCRTMEKILPTDTYFNVPYGIIRLILAMAIGCFKCNNGSFARTSGDRLIKAMLKGTETEWYRKLSKYEMLAIVSKHSYELNYNLRVKNAFTYSCNLTFMTQSAVCFYEDEQKIAKNYNVDIEIFVKEGRRRNLKIGFKSEEIRAWWVEYYVTRR